MRKLKTILQSKYIFKIITLIFLIYAILFTNLYKYKSIYNINVNSIEGVITNYNIDGNKLSINLKAKEKLIVNYYINSKEEKDYYINYLELGSKIKVVGTLKEASNNTIPNLFNYKKYLYNNQIYYLMDANEIKIISNNKSILYYVKNMIIKRIDSIDNTGYLKVFILGIDDDLKNDIQDSYKFNGVSHLFSISGSHIVIISSIIIFLLTKITYNRKIIYLITNIVVIIYFLIADFSASILRSVIMFILLSLNKCYNLKIKTFDIILLVLVIAIIINPFYIYNIGFQFSYLISLTLILLSNKLKNIKNYFFKNAYISFVSLLISFPISIYNFYQINFLSILINIILIPLVSIIIFPLSILTFIFPFLISIFNISINIMEYISKFFSDITLFQLNLSKPSLILILLYYIFIYLSIIYNKKIYILLIITIIIHKSYIYLTPKVIITYLDVGQGDAIFIKLPYNKGNVLIDTGGIISYEKEEWQKRSNEYSIADSKIIPYINSLGIEKIDYLIITHGDYDHMGESINLVNNFTVRNVILNCGVYNDLEKKLIEVLEKNKIKYISCIKELKIDNYKLLFLNNIDYNNENDNSNVVYTRIINYKFLFMGDAGIKVEESLINKYNLKDIDVLKIGHHGSKTSSSKNFINEVFPKYSVISVGKNNRYNHPDSSVLDNLSDSIVYRTDRDGSIVFKIINKELEIENYEP